MSSKLFIAYIKIHRPISNTVSKCFVIMLYLQIYIWSNYICVNMNRYIYIYICIRLTTRIFSFCLCLFSLYTNLLILLLRSPNGMYGLEQTRTFSGIDINWYWLILILIDIDIDWYWYWLILFLKSLKGMYIPLHWHAVSTECSSEKDSVVKWHYDNQ